MMATSRSSKPKSQTPASVHSIMQRFQLWT